LKEEAGYGAPIAHPAARHHPRAHLHEPHRATGGGTRPVSRAPAG
jgi:hypothetical protein